jgi:hypothetical protein
MRQRLIALLSDLGIACPHVLKEARQNEARPSDVGPAVKPAGRIRLKIAVAAPIPNAIVTTAAIERPALRMPIPLEHPENVQVQIPAAA